MTYCFRIRGDFARSSHLNIAVGRLQLTPSDEPIVVVLRPGDSAENLAKARRLDIRGGPFGSELEAYESSVEWLNRLRCLMITMGVGVDFGERAPKGWASEEWLAQLADEYGAERVLYDNPGVTVYECEPSPRFAELTVTGVSSPGQEAIDRALAFAGSASPNMTGAVRVAYDLLAASMSVADEARLLLLMASLETLLERDFRSDAAVEHLAHLTAETLGNERLPDHDRDSIVSALSDLRRESIGRAGRQYVARLSPKTYGGKGPAAFFGECYSMRSELIHGAQPRPPREVVDPLAALLEVMVTDLLRTEIGFDVPP